MNHTEQHVNENVIRTALSNVRDTPITSPEWANRTTIPLGTIAELTIERRANSPQVGIVMEVPKAVVDRTTPITPREADGNGIVVLSPNKEPTRLSDLSARLERLHENIETVIRDVYAAPTYNLDMYCINHTTNTLEFAGEFIEPKNMIDGVLEAEIHATNHEQPATT